MDKIIPEKTDNKEIIEAHPIFHKSFKRMIMTNNPNNIPKMPSNNPIKLINLKGK